MLQSADDAMQEDHGLPDGRDTRNGLCSGEPAPPVTVLEPSLKAPDVLARAGLPIIMDGQTGPRKDIRICANSPCGFDEHACQSDRAARKGNSALISQGLV
jgi:hypothetical protein